MQENVFIDDRCPTVWEAPRFSSSRTSTRHSEPRSHDETEQTSASRGDAPLLTTRVKPIEGHLLRKLLRATLEEKQRIAEERLAAKPAPAEEAPPAKDIKIKSVDPHEFYLPAGLGTPRSSAHNAKKEKSAPASTVLPGKLQSFEEDLVPGSASHGEWEFIKVPMSQPSIATVSDGSASPPFDIAEEPVREELTIPPVTVQEKLGKKKNKKELRKNKKAKAREQKEIAKQAGNNVDIDLTDDKPTKHALIDDDMLMSGALPAATALDDGFEGLLDRSNSSHITSKKDHATMQATVESVASRHLSKASGVSKAASTRAPAPATPTKLSSSGGFQQVGEAWTGPAASRHGSSRSSKRFPDSVGFEDLGQHHLEPHSSVLRSKRSSPSKVLGTPTPKGSTHNFPLAISEPAVEKVREKKTKVKSHNHERHSVHSSVRSGYHRSYTIENHAIVRRSSKIRSRSSSLEHSPLSKLLGHGPRRGNSPNSVQGDDYSSKSRRSESQSNARAPLSRGRRSQAADSRSDWKDESAGFDRTSFHGSQHASQKSVISSERSSEKPRSSRTSRRPSRHASTRSFSPKDVVWEGSPSIRSSAKSGSRRSPTPRLEVIPETSSDKHSRIKSVIGSVASKISRVRSELTFEQVGEGFHNGGVSSNEVKRNSSGTTYSSAQASSRALQPLSNNHYDDEGSPLRRSQPSQYSHSEQSRSKSSTHSQRHSTHSTRRSHYGSEHRDHQSSLPPSNLSQRSESNRHVRTLVGFPVHAVVSSADGRSAISSRIDDNADMHEYGMDRGQRPTVFAGRGWITPHPLESSISETQSAIIVPSDALPNGATLSYEEWKIMQEDGIRNHRNFSTTESKESERRRHKEDRYRFSGWEARSWQEVEPATRDPNAASARVLRRSKASEVRTGGSETVSERSVPDSYRSQKSRHGRAPMVSPSERAWEKMEEGDAGARSHREDSVLSEDGGVRAYPEWN